MEGVINDSERIRRNGVEMVRETRSMKRGEHLRSESKVPRVGKVIRDVGRKELAAGEKVTILVAGGEITQVDQIELVHLAIVHGKSGRRPAVVDIVRISIGGAAHWDYLSRRKLARFRAIGCIEGAKHVVVGSVFLDQEDDVIDFLNPGWPSARLRAGDGNSGKKQASESPGIGHEKPPAVSQTQQKVSC
jgi:hypothetical protein